MKVVLLAGGFGTRISEESYLKPKPMVEIGDMPILWHVMKTYAHYGFNDFIVCCGYKGYVIKEYFADYYLHRSDVTFDFADGNKMVVHNNVAEPWKVTLVDTGLNTMTGGRVKRVQKYVGNEPFMLTYGDGLSNINISKLVEFHKTHGKLATVTAVQPSGKFGALDLSTTDTVNRFQEKPRGDGSWINGGFFVMQPEVFEYIQGDGMILEREPLEGLARDQQLVAYKHEGFWQPMDTLKDKMTLEEQWTKGTAPWKIWE